MTSDLRRALTAFLLVVLVASFVGTAYVALDPPRTPNPYSEFYLLGPGGEADEYPTTLEPGEEGTVTVGVTNHEGEITRYVVRVVDQVAENGSSLATKSRRVAAGETWETNVTFAIEDPGRHRVQFQLYRGSESRTPSLTTRLWVTVTNGSATTTEEGTAAAEPAEERPATVKRRPARVGVKP